MTFSIEDFFSKCNVTKFLRNWLHLLKKSVMENSIFCVVKKTLLTITLHLINLSSALSQSLFNHCSTSHYVVQKVFPLNVISARKIYWKNESVCQKKIFHFEITFSLYINIQWLHQIKKKLWHNDEY